LTPPSVPWQAFTSNVATLWLAGLFNGGLAVACFLAIVLVVVASHLPYRTLTRLLSVLPVSLGSAVLCALGYVYAVQETFAAGLPR
jgi:hypothetical protein